MTWQDLVDRILSSIPEERRNESAVFYLEEEGEGWTIDEMEKIDTYESDGRFDCTVGNDEGETFVLIP